ncbi:tetratricopeptide repeat protein [Cytophagales bacterium LB-30]|uniref:Tetratricopeptide repeat protein n=1 Tax=Shiella aurantiaca TaxID=3058365 RepID=A0ABT8F6C4_9BACT|nr:tetratricopeptide repeat protein [Shiella aurantiaca]MDN4165824.1 tetratricopeptide repeat protein [Shiella aurantiaca]
MKARCILSVLGLLLVSQTLLGQDNWKWPEDPAQRSIAEEKNVLYSDYLRADNFTSAKKPLEWLLVNTPDLNPSIYINGAKVFEGLIEEEKDAARKAILQDSLIMIYDLRIKYFNEKASVTDRKAYSSYKYWRDRKEKYPEMYAIFNEAFELNGNEMSSYNLVAYMDAVRRHKLTSKDVTDEKAIEIYEKISDVIDYQIKNKVTDEDKLLKIKDNIDKVFVGTVTITCDLIENNLGSKFNANPTDIKLAKNIFKLGFASKCTDSDIFLKATEYYFSQEPEFGLAKLVAIKYIQRENYEKAISFYEKAVSLTDENIKKAEIYLSVAEILYKKGQKANARDYAFKAVATDPSSAKDAYTLVGNMYMTSYEQCKGENPVKDRAVFLAAYEMYKKAGNSQGMQSAKEQFPSIEEIFTQNMEVGQAISTGCWVNESVIIQRRD